MSQAIPQSPSRELPATALSGWLMLAVVILWLLAALALTLASAAGRHPPGFLAGLLLLAAGIVMCFGFFTLQPNEARVQILFGSYKGTVREGGIRWANPFYSRSRDGGGRRPLSAWLQGAPASANSAKLSLRVHNFNSDKLKVNDKRGNPVEIAAVVVWRVYDTAQAVFDVEDYKSYVHVQSESALRGIASRFAYDHGEQHEPTLRGSADEVAQALTEELQVRLAKAGVIVEEARLTHLAYAPEIASVMLRRQQAEAIIAARQQIVHGAVGMVHTALQELDARQVVQLDPEKKAAMVSNLLVVLCGNSDASPVINTGTLYS